MKIYVAMANADMTEGRGPMRPVKYFLHEEDALCYIDQQEGIMGRKMKWSQEEYGDWRVEEIDVNEESIIDREKVRRERINHALGKLGQDEIELLGLEKMAKENLGGSR